MFSRFFIERPVFSWVLAIFMMLAGLLSISKLPVSQLPAIAPPQISITASYPGASAQTVSNTVVQLIEQNLTGLDGYLYMSSTADSSGQANIVVTFEAGTDPQLAQVQIQNKIQGVLPRLPQTVQQMGVHVDQTSADTMMVAAFTSTNGEMNQADLGDFLVSSMKEPLSRVEGVGDVMVFGTPYAMRIWLDPKKLEYYHLDPRDVIAAISSQNVQVPAGAMGGMPYDGRQPITATIASTSLMETPDQFEKIFLKADADGGVVRLKDVARVEVGQENYLTSAIYKGQPVAGIAIKLANGANAMMTADRVKAKLDELKATFPEGVDYVIPYDTTPFVEAALHEVVKTLIEAIILVVLVMYLFLQNFRATLIPTIAVPVVLLGAFAALYAFGYSINMLTMFAMVLAIGLLVDDAIVVVENVERVMQEDKTDAKTATIKSMGEIQSALVGIALVLSAVFVPMAFFGGSTGVIYRQFSVTIVSAMVLSVIVALTLTPALCATFLKVDPNHGEKRGFFGWFNKWFERMTGSCQRGTGKLIRVWWLALLVYAGLLAFLGWGFMKIPTAFMPQEDQGSLLLTMQLPENASMDRTKDELRKIQNFLEKTESDSVEHSMLVSGFSFSGSGSNMGMGFIKLKDWAERPLPSQSVEAIQKRLMGAFMMSPLFKEAVTYVFPLPPVPGLGVADGFDMFIQNNGSDSHEKMMAYMNEYLMRANQDKRMTMVRHNGLSDGPSLKLTIDQDKLAMLKVYPSAVNQTISAVLSGAYVNDYLDRGRVKQVWVQGDAVGRMDPDAILGWKVRNTEGKMVPLNAVAKLEWIYDSPRLERFNGLPAVNIQGSPAPGVSTGEAMQAAEELARQVFPEDYSVAWSGVSYQEKASGEQGASLFIISLLVVFLSLAALYESWTIPFSVLLVIPCGVVGALGLTWALGFTNDVYFKVGLLTTMGIVSKNAILIVEFAKDFVAQGKDVLHAAEEAIRVRLRPILMTSLAFGLGVLPLALAHGAGAGAQNSIGVGVLGGMLAGTVLCLTFTPVFYYLVLRLAGQVKKTDNGK